MPKSVIDTAKAQVIAYNDKDWDAVRRCAAAQLYYDEVATQRKARGVDDVIKLWLGWATALPDSRATFEGAVASGNTVTLELTWRGTHKGPLKTPAGELAPTGKQIELRSCQVIEVDGDKVKSVRQYFDMGTLLKQLGA
jgi:steroid delta-isomerase-like uncharacterized protein